MTKGGPARLQELLALGDGDRSSSMLELICSRTVSGLAVSGAGITALSKVEEEELLQRGLVHATNEISHRLDHLQLTVGEGPCLDAFSSSAPVLVADLATDGLRWPGFTPAARELGAAGVFSFPCWSGRCGWVR